MIEVIQLLDFFPSSFFFEEQGNQASSLHEFKRCQKMLLHSNDIFYKVRDLFLQEGEEVTFYGGSFHPWHQGHLECLRSYPSSCIIVYLDMNHHKEFATDWWQDRLLWQEYLHINELITKEFHGKEHRSLKKQKIFVFPGGRGREAPIPSYQWIEQLTTALGQHFTYALLLGADTFMSFHKWVQVESIFQKIRKIYVAQRLINKNALKEQRKLFLEEYPSLHEIEFLCHHPYESLRSRDLRRSCETGIG